MTEPERDLVMMIAKVWDGFLALPVEHDDDTSEFRQGVHTLQRMILARPSRRKINGMRHL